MIVVLFYLITNKPVPDSAFCFEHSEKPSQGRFPSLSDWMRLAPWKLRFCTFLNTPFVFVLRESTVLRSAVQILRLGTDNTATSVFATSEWIAAKRDLDKSTSRSRIRVVSI